jgi:hypothetical protein
VDAHRGDGNRSLCAPMKTGTAGCDHRPASKNKLMRLLRAYRKVSARLELRKLAPQTVLNSQ